MTAAPYRRGRQIQPTIARQLASFLAILDPRCEFEAHNEIASAPWPVCPHCRLDIAVYVDALPMTWPEP